MSAVQPGRQPPRGELESAHSTTVILVDDRTLTRQCLAHWLELNDHNFRTIGIPRLDQPERLLRRYGRIDLVVLNVGAMTASEPAIRGMLDRLQEALPEVPLIVVSDREDIAAVTEAIKRGVRGYIPTSLDSHVVVEALHFVRAGGTFVPASALIKTATTVQGPAPPEDPREPSLQVLGFTQRELQVLEHVRQGKPNKIIAHELVMQESTVKVHVRRIMKKLNATNRTQAAFLAQRLAEAAEAPDRLRRRQLTSNAEADVLLSDGQIKADR